MLSNRKPFSASLSSSLARPTDRAAVSCISKRRNGDVPNGNFSLSLFLPLFCILRVRAGLDRKMPKLGVEASHISKYHSASEGIFEAHAYRGPPRGSSVCPSGSPSTCCGLRHRDPAVKFMHRTFNYYTNPLTTLLSVRAVAKVAPYVRVRTANCRL